MSATDEPAFPFQAGDGCGNLMEPAYGMSLRDWFAGHAPPPPDHFTIPSAECDDWGDAEKSSQAWSDWCVRRAVAWSFAYANTMLAARAKGA